MMICSQVLKVRFLSIWRYDFDFNCNTTVFSSLEKAENFREQEKARLIEDFSIDEKDVDNFLYDSQDVNYFDIWIEEQELV